MSKMILFLLMASLPLTAEAEEKIQVACTLTTIESIVKEIGGDRIETFALSAGDQDPHFVSPTPVLMNRVRDADLLIELGMLLETWADEVANGSGNPRIFRGAPGRIVLSSGVPKLEVPDVLTRAQGDVHPEGNPHLWLDPIRAKLLAANAARALKAASPKDAAYFDQRLAAFRNRVDHALFGEKLVKALGAAKLERLALDGRLHSFLETNQLGGTTLAKLAGGWLKMARPLRNQPVIEFHKVWVYFARTFGFEVVATIEEKPGIPPGPRHIAQTIELAKIRSVRLILVDNFYNTSTAERIASDSGAHVVSLPNQVRGEKGADDYFALIDHILRATTAALDQKGARLE